MSYNQIQYFHQDNLTALMVAASYRNADVVTVLLEAGASIEAKNKVSKRISICTCVCVMFLHHSVVLFYSSILLL